MAFVDWLTQQADQRVPDAGVRDAARGEKKLHGLPSL
jgi:hypothetical protein